MALQGRGDCLTGFLLVHGKGHLPIGNTGHDTVNREVQLGNNDYLPNSRSAVHTTISRTQRSLALLAFPEWQPSLQLSAMAYEAPG